MMIPTKPFYSCKTILCTLYSMCILLMNDFTAMLMSDAVG